MKQARKKVRSSLLSSPYKEQLMIEREEKGKKEKGEGRKNQETTRSKRR
jgi:hypothetical protein